MVDESSCKRRRIHDAGFTAHSSTCAPDLLPATMSEIPPETRDFLFSNAEPFLSPATISSWSLDTFAHDPDYLASQETLRVLQFTTARSAAPTRPGTPVELEERIEISSMKSTLVKGNRIQNLQNYLSQVAPWVSNILATLNCLQGKYNVNR
jgi:hypothetical protein